MDAALPLPSRRLQVFYVEDGAASRGLMQALFRLRPHLELHMAHDGVEATALGRSLNPALIVIDLHLADCLGSELLPLLSLRFGWRGVPAVAMTAEADYEPDRAVFQEVWRKPLDLPQVLQRLDAWLPAGSIGMAPHGTARPTVTHILH